MKKTAPFPNQDRAEVEKCSGSSKKTRRQFVTRENASRFEHDRDKGSGCISHDRHVDPSGSGCTTSRRESVSKPTDAQNARAASLNS